MATPPAQAHDMGKDFYESFPSNDWSRFLLDVFFQ
jgi:hypothetical protein